MEEDGVVLPCFDAAAESLITDDMVIDVLAQGAAAKKSPKNRKRQPEFDASGNWADVRRFNRMPITTENAGDLEKASGLPHGMYFVSLGRRRISGIIDLHRRWLLKIKNQNSSYLAIQKDLMDFFEDMQRRYDARYAIYTGHPAFDVIGKTRRRSSPEK